MNSRKAISKIEIILVMVLILLMGLSVFTLVISSSDTYKKVITQKDELTELRIAASYIDNKIKQAGSENAIEVRNNLVNNQPSIVITEKSDGEIYETWIYQSEDSLKETYIKQGQLFDENMSFVIANVKELRPSIDKSVLNIKLTGNTSSDIPQIRKLKINLRANGS